MNKNNLMLIILSVVFSSHVLASDLAKEKRWVDETVDSILDGDAVWLKADNHEFLSIYTEAEDESQQGMIVIHGTGIHPNWPQIVQPIRVEMTTLGWNTLSIQMPILANDKQYEDYIPLYPEVIPRIQAAEKYMLEQGMKKIILVAHSQGAIMTSYYLLHSKSEASALAFIGMPARISKNGINTLKTLETIKLPILDLFGSDDLPNVLSTAKQRKVAAKNNKNYSQVKVEGANHFFDDMNEALISNLEVWLEKLK